MILLFPYKKIVFESPLSKEEVIRRLSLEVTKPLTGLRWLERRTEKFQGKVTEEGFQIRRIIRSRNSFLPIIRGRFTPSVPGVRIEVTMKLHPGIVVFSILWLGFVGGLAVFTIPQMLATGSIDSQGLVGWAMLFIFYLAVTISFGVEANKASKLLSSIFEVNEA